MNTAFLSSLFLALLLTTSGCLNEGCKKTEAPEINFNMFLFANIQIKNTKDEDVTSQFVDNDFNMMCYKVYCDGTNKGPFTTEFKVNEDGSLYKKSIGYYGFRMDNTEDYMRVSFFLGGNEAGHYNVYYNQLKAFDGANPYLNFTIKYTLVSNTIEVESINVSIS